MGHYREENLRIGRLVARLRKQKSISASELARRVGLSQPQISRLENGKQGFRSETLTRVSNALGVTPAYFFVAETDAVQREKERATVVQAQMGAQLAGDIEQQYGEVAVTPAFRQSLKRLAQALARPDADPKLLRRLLEQIFAMSNAERATLFEDLVLSRSRNSISTK